MADLVFAHVPEFHHGKGYRRTRQGKPFSHIGRALLTPNQKAAKTLFSFLKQHPNITENARYLLKSEMEGLNQIRFMSMEVLAATLAFMQQFQTQDDMSSFTSENLRPFVDRLMPSGELEEDRDIVRLRLEVTIVRYALLVNEFRAQQDRAVRNTH